MEMHLQAATNTSGWDTSDESVDGHSLRELEMALLTWTPRPAIFRTLVPGFASFVLGMLQLFPLVVGGPHPACGFGSFSALLEGLGCVDGQSVRWLSRGRFVGSKAKCVSDTEAAGQK